MLRISGVKVALTPQSHFAPMVTRRRVRTILNTIALYTIAVLLIGYFGINAYTGDHGLRAKQDLDTQIKELTYDLESFRAGRANWERRVALLQSQNIDAYMLDERARALLNYT